MPQFVVFDKGSGLPAMAEQPFIWNGEDGETIATIAAELYPDMVESMIPGVTESPAERAVDAAMEILKTALFKMEAHNKATEKNMAEHIDQHSRIVRPAGKDIGEYGGGQLRHKRH